MSFDNKISYKRSEGEVWKTPSGKWRAISPSGIAKSFDQKDSADTYAKGSQSEEEESPKSEVKEVGIGVNDTMKKLRVEPTVANQSEKRLNSFVGKFFNKVENASERVKNILFNSSATTKQFVVDTTFRKEALSKSARVLKENSSKIAQAIVSATKSEAVDFASPVTAPVKVLLRMKNGERPLLKESEKFSLYSGLVYWGCIVGSFSMSHMSGFGGVSPTQAGLEIGDAFMHSFTIHSALGAVVGSYKSIMKKNPESVPSKSEIEKSIQGSETLSKSEKKDLLNQLVEVQDDPNKLFLFLEKIENTNLFLSIFGMSGFLPSGLSTGALYKVSPWSLAKSLAQGAVDVASKLGSEEVKQVKDFIDQYADTLENTTDEDMLYLASMDNPFYEESMDYLNKGDSKEIVREALMKMSALRVAKAYQEKKKIKNQEGEETTLYLYSESQIKKRNKEKSQKVEKLRQCIDSLRKKYQKDISSEDSRLSAIATVVGLIDLTYERVGNPKSADNGHFGITGLQKQHLTFSGGKVTLKYTGKSGVEHKKEIRNAKVIKMLKSFVKGKSKGDFIFTYGEDNCCVSARVVNEYLKEFEISAKDIRGFHANEEMKKALKRVRSKGGKLPSDPKEREKKLKEEFSEAIEQVAEMVGHTKSTLKNQYLVPHMEDTFKERGKVITNLKASAKRVATLYLATKTESEKEDKQVEDIHKKNPKERPPRYDLRKRRLEEEDKDLETGVKGDKDISLKHEDHKRASKRVARRWLYSKVWQTEGGFGAESPDGKKQYGFKSEEAAKEWLAEQDVEEPPEEVEVEEEESNVEDLPEEYDTPDSGGKSKEEESKEKKPKKEDPKKETTKKEESKDKPKKEEAEPFEEDDAEEDHTEIDNDIDEIEKTNPKLFESMSSLKGLEDRDFKKKIMESVETKIEILEDTLERGILITSEEISSMTRGKDPATLVKQYNSELKKIKSKVTIDQKEKLEDLKEKYSEKIVQAYRAEAIEKSLLVNPNKIGGDPVNTESGKNLDPSTRFSQSIAQVSQYSNVMIQDLKKNLVRELANHAVGSPEHTQYQAVQDAILAKETFSKSKGNGLVGALMGDLANKDLKDLENVHKLKDKSAQLMQVMTSNPVERQRMIGDIVRELPIKEVESLSPVFGGFAEALEGKDLKTQKYVKNLLADFYAEFESEDEVHQIMKSLNRESPKHDRSKVNTKVETNFAHLALDMVKNLLSTEEAFKGDEASSFMRLNYLVDIAKKNGNVIEPDVLESLKKDHPLAFADEGNLSEDIKRALEGADKDHGSRWYQGKKDGVDVYGAKNQNGLIRYFNTKESAEKWTSIFKSSSQNQSLAYNSNNIDRDIFNFNSTISNWRTNIMSSLNKQGAVEITKTLDKLASQFESRYHALGIPKKYAFDFAYRCDLLSDEIDTTFGLKREASQNKEALDGLDPVLEPGFNPEDIGKEKKGPKKELGKEHSWMDGEFTQQENRELRETQEAGKMPEVKTEPRKPQEGKQATDETIVDADKLASDLGLNEMDKSLENLSKQADLAFISQCADMRDQLKICSLKLKDSGVASLKSVASSCDKMSSSLDKIKEKQIEVEALGSESLNLEVASEKAVNAVSEIMPYIEKMCSALSSLQVESPLAQFSVEEMLDQHASKLSKLVGLAEKIVSKAVSEMSKKDEE